MRRLLTALILAVLAAGTLTACQTKVGQAADVGGQTLSDSTLAGYVRPGATPYADQSGNQVVPKLNALTVWVRNRLLEGAIAAKGGPAKASEVSAARNVIVQSQIGSGLRTSNAAHGYTPRFDDLLVEQYSLLIVLIERLAPQADAAQAFNLLQSGRASSAFVPAIRAAKTPVDLSPRYGKWDDQILAVSQDPTAGAPAFVHFGSSS